MHHLFGGVGVPAHPHEAWGPLHIPTKGAPPPPHVRTLLNEPSPVASAVWTPARHQHIVSYAPPTVNAMGTSTASTTGLHWRHHKCVGRCVSCNTGLPTGAQSSVDFREQAPTIGWTRQRDRDQRPRPSIHGSFPDFQNDALTRGQTPNMVHCGMPLPQTGGGGGMALVPAPDQTALFEVPLPRGKTKSPSKRVVRSSAGASAVYPSVPSLPLLGQYQGRCPGGGKDKGVTAAVQVPSNPHTLCRTSCPLSALTFLQAIPQKANRKAHRTRVTPAAQRKERSQHMSLGDTGQGGSRHCMHNPLP